MKESQLDPMWSLLLVSISFLLAGAGVIASTQVREMVVIVPLFWTAWMLHSMQRTRGTIKHEVLARRLEDLVNSSLGYPVHIWNSALTSGGKIHTSVSDSNMHTSANGEKVLTTLPSYLNYAFWIGLNITSWVISTVVLFRSDRPVLAVLLIVVGVVVYAGALHWSTTNESFRRRCKAVADLQASEWIESHQTS